MIRLRKGQVYRHKKEGTLWIYLGVQTTGWGRGPMFQAWHSEGLTLQTKDKKPWAKSIFKGKRLSK